MDTKTKNNPEAFSSENSFNITLPPYWADLDDSQLICFFTLMSHDLDMEQVLTVCLFKWADLRLLCRTANGSYLVKQHTVQSSKPHLPFSRSSLPQQPSTT